MPETATIPRSIGKVTFYCGDKQYVAYPNAQGIVWCARCGDSFKVVA